jgi:hypothetical protein
MPGSCQGGSFGGSSMWPIGGRPITVRGDPQPAFSDARAAHDGVWDAGQVVVALPSDPVGVAFAAVVGAAMLVWGVVGGLDYRGAATRYRASLVRYWSGGPIRRRLTPPGRIPSVGWWRGFFWVLAAVSFMVLVWLPFGR